MVASHALNLELEALGLQYFVSIYDFLAGLSVHFGLHAVLEVAKVAVLDARDEILEQRGGLHAVKDTCTEVYWCIQRLHILLYQMRIKVPWQLVEGLAQLLPTSPATCRHAPRGDSSTYHFNFELYSLDVKHS